MNYPNSITKMLNIEFPLIQAPMFGVTTPEMVSAAAKANALGSLALADLEAEKCLDLIQSTKKLTDKNFAVNIFVHDIPPITDELKNQYASAKKFIEDLAEQHHLDVKLSDFNEIKVQSYHEQLEIIIAENCKILSFTFGNLDPQSIDLLKSKGITLIGTCTSLNEALILEKSGIDIICVQGIEAGGHRGSFKSENIPQIGGLSLLSQVKNLVKVPLIYAGGIYNAQTMSAAETLGAEGFQIGSLLLGSSESALKKFEKERLRTLNEEDIILTNSFSGRYARGIKNIFTETMKQTPHILPYPYQNKLTNELRRAAKAHENTDFVSIWVGQSINEYRPQSVTEIMRDLIAES